MLSEESKQILIKRLKSLGWRVGVMLAVAGVSFMADNISLFHLAPQVQVFIGLALGEVTKYLNSKQ